MDIDLEILKELQSENPQPVYILSGSGPAWYYSDLKKAMIKVSRGSECLFCEQDPGNDEKYIVQIGYEVFSIHKKELLEIGWN